MYCAQREHTQPDEVQGTRHVEAVPIIGIIQPPYYSLGHKRNSRLTAYVVTTMK